MCQVGAYMRQSRSSPDVVASALSTLSSSDSSVQSPSLRSSSSSSSLISATAFHNGLTFYKRDLVKMVENIELLSCYVCFSDRLTDFRLACKRLNSSYSCVAAKNL